MDATLNHMWMHSSDWNYAAMPDARTKIAHCMILTKSDLVENMNQSIIYYACLIEKYN